MGLWDFRSKVFGMVVGGVQVACVKASTSFRMKKRGKVPPRLETLEDQTRGEEGGFG